MKEIKLALPLSEDDVRKLKVGDMVLLSGKLYTGRDAVHKYLYEGNSISTINLSGSAIYHCGPVVIERDGNYQVMAAGPTTSTREEPYQATVIEKFNIKAVIGKGGMGRKTLEACQKFGCVYLHAVGGAAQVLAEKVVKVTGVHMLKEFGSPEAVWELEVNEFPALVTIDAHGQSLHAEIDDKSKDRLQELMNLKK